MSSFEDDELTIQLCKLAGPIFVFVFTPLLLLIFGNLFIEEIRKGSPIKVKNIIEISFIFFSISGFGVWMCRKGYGWFGGTKP